MTSNYEHVKRYRASKPWARPREYARRRCTDKRHREYVRYGGAGITFDLTMWQAARLYERDQAHLLRKPSLDRIDPTQGYTYENCRFIEHSDNIRRHGNPEAEEQQPKTPEDIKWEE